MVSTYLTQPIRGLLAGLAPVERLTPSQWADKYRYLSSVSSAEPGLWRTSRVPYLREIMDRFSKYDECQEVIVIKGAQIGMSECGFNVAGYYIDLDPSPIMYVMPTVDTIKRNSKTRIDPMIKATPRLTAKISQSKSRDNTNTIFQKDFNGGTLILSGANSAASLRSVPIKILVLDEVDGFPLDVDGEGNPVKLAKARTRTFANKKIFMLSTPTIEGQSMIKAEFLKTSQRYYFVPCPHCGGMQNLEWNQVKWEKNKPETAKYLCIHCDEYIEERFKTKMLELGEWQETKPELSSSLRVGYHISSLYSPLGWYSWKQAAQDWIDAQKSQEDLKVFINTVLGQTWKEKGERPDWENLYNRRIPYPTNEPPKDVAILTAGVDVQSDRLELEIVGWCKGKVSYSIDYRVLIGDPSEKFVWNELAKVVNEKWVRADGVELGLSRMAIDTGYKTTEVYKFCRRFHPTQVIPVKGQDRQPIIISTPTAVDRNRKGKRIGALALYSVGVSILKSELYGWLKLKIEDGETPDGYCYFPKQYDEHFFKMLTAEMLQKELKKGFPVYTWVKLRERNEALDCRNYARAAAAVVGIDRWKPNDWDVMLAMGTRSKPARNKTQQPTEKRKKRGSGFW